MINKGELIDNRYKIVKSIGEGGMANVYLAWDTILEREVAVKVLRGDLSDDEKFVRRFEREANSASSLRHPNIVEMYDVGEDNGKYFIVMEFIDGRTLKSLIKKRGALNLTEAIDIMLQITSGIACAHDSYIIHRDIKPQNVLILEDGRVKITDFGIALALNNHELTQTNSVMGSVHYLPPEQASGNSATVKSDIYSLGILFYELIIGKVPFKGENAVEIAIKHMKEPIPSVRSINPNIPQSVENIILRASAKNPKNRYDSVSEMYEDLKNCLGEDRINEERVVYKYPEHAQGESKSINKLESRESKNKDINEASEDRKINIALKIIGLVAIIIVIIGLLFIWIVSSDKNSDVTIPSDLIGKTEKEACKKVKKLGLNCNVKYEFDSDYDEDIVMSISPKAGSKIKEGTSLTLTVSSYEDTIEIEDYTKKNVEVVKSELEDLGVKVVTRSKKVTEAEEYDENDIIEQSIPAGKRVESKKSTIELIYATLITVYPDFTDGTYDKDKIQQFCEDNDIVCNFKEEEDNNYKEGTILLQSRDVGDEVRAGSTLTITIAKNKEEKKTTNKQDKKESEDKEKTEEDTNDR